MKTYLLITLLLGVCSFLYLKIAEKYNIIDKPNQRSSHALTTIRGGGILFLVAVLIFFFTNDFQYPYFVLGVVTIAVVSFIDDIRSLSSKLRLPFQFIAVGLVFYQLSMGVESLWLFPVLLIIGVLFLNSFNFMDGINGITGMYSIAVLSGFFYINYENEFINNDFIIYLLLSLIVFGYYNFRKKARFFAGDIGSISMAMVILFCLLILTRELMSPIILLFIVVYGADALMTLLYKVVIREKMSQPHRHHIYQKLVDVLKWSHLKVSILYALLQLMINCIVFYAYQLELSVQYALLFAVVFIFIIGYVLLFRFLKLKSKSL